VRGEPQASLAAFLLAAVSAMLRSARGRSPRGREDQLLPLGTSLISKRGY
jgi:hypothetical protein